MENIGKQEITGSFRQIQDNPGICNTNGLQNKRISDSSKNRSPLRTDPPSDLKPCGWWGNHHKNMRKFIFQGEYSFSKWC